LFVGGFLLGGNFVEQFLIELGVAFVGPEGDIGADVGGAQGEQFFEFDAGIG
jgi:hypothetical protein